MFLNMNLIYCITHIPADSPSLGRSLRHFRLAKISVRGDGNLRHLSIDFFGGFSFSGHHFVFSSYNPDDWIMQKTAMASRRSESLCAGNARKKESVQGPL